MLFVSPLFPSSSFTAKGMDELPMELGKLDISDRFIQTASIKAEKKRDNIITRVYVFEGEIEVTSPLDGTMKVLRQNEILEADRRGLGETRFDPERTKRFFEDVMSGMDGKPKTGSQRLDDRFHREQMERTEKMIDIRQREIETEIRGDRELGRSDPAH
jgi:hypothetical protein